MGMVAWAWAATQFRPVSALTALGWQVAERAWEFSAEDLAKIVMCFANLKLCHKCVMDTISMEVMWKIDQFSSHSLATVAAACVKMGYGKEPTFDWLAMRFNNSLDDFSAEDMAAVMWSFAHSSISTDALAVNVADQV